MERKGGRIACPVDIISSLGGLLIQKRGGHIFLGTKQKVKIYFI